MTTKSDETTANILSKDESLNPIDENNASIYNNLTVEKSSNDEKHEEDAATPINDLTDIKLKVKSRLPSTRINKRDLSIIGICGSTVSLVIFGILAIIPLSKLIIGWKYAEQCPINWHIPHYLIVAGVLGLVLVLIGIIQGAATLYTMLKVSEDKGAGKRAVAVLCVCSLTVLLVLLSIFLFIWFIAGCVWIFGAWSTVQYSDPTRSDYCHPTLYRFAYILIILSLIIQLFSCLRSCFRSRTTVNMAKNVRFQAPTEEP